MFYITEARALKPVYTDVFDLSTPFSIARIWTSNVVREDTR